MEQERCVGRHQGFGRVDRGEEDSIDLCLRLRNVKTNLLSPDEPKTSDKTYDKWIDAQGVDFSLLFLDRRVGSLDLILFVPHDVHVSLYVFDEMSFDIVIVHRDHLDDFVVGGRTDVFRADYLTQVILVLTPLYIGRLSLASSRAFGSDRIGGRGEGDFFIHLGDIRYHKVGILTRCVFNYNALSLRSFLTEGMYDALTVIEVKDDFPYRRSNRGTLPVSCGFFQHNIAIFLKGSKKMA